MAFKNQKKVLRGTSKHLALYKDSLEPGDLISINNTYRVQCDFACLHCGNEFAPKVGVLSLDERKKVLDSSKAQFDTKTLVLPGEGDPMLDPYLKELIRHAYGLGMTTVMFNTAYRIPPEYADFLKEHDVSLILSFSDADKDNYEKFVRLPGSFERVMENIEYIASIYRETVDIVTTEEIKKNTGKDIGDKHVYRVGFNSDINRQNHDSVEEIINLARSLDIMQVFNYPWIEGEATEHTKELIGQNNHPEDGLDDPYIQLMRYAFQMSDNDGLFFVTPDRMCGMETLGLSIGTNGRLQQCPYRVDADMSMGHINKYRKPDGTYDLKLALDDKIMFWEENKVGICSIRHGGKKFKENLRSYRILK